MAIEISKETQRVFIHKGNEIEDPDRSLSSDEVQGFLSTRYPELTTATIAGPEMKAGKAVYTFKTTVGTKG